MKSLCQDQPVSRLPAMNCKDCQYFKIAYEPMMPFDMGLAVCTKHNLEVDFADRKKINKLVCIENEKEETE